MTSLNDILLQGFCWFILAVAAGVGVGAMWRQLPTDQRRLLPVQRHPSVPWTGAEVWFAVVAVVLFWPWLVLGLLSQGSFLSALYGPGSPLGRRLDTWGELFILPLSAVSIVFLLRVWSGTRPHQIGLTFVRLPQNVAAGYLLWLVLTPSVYLVYDLVTLWITPEEHPLAQVARDLLLPIEWVLIVVETLLLAPLLEELLFRGVLQGWLARRRWGSHVTFLGAFLCALGLGWDRFAVPVFGSEKAYQENSEKEKKYVGRLTNEPEEPKQDGPHPMDAYRLVMTADGRETVLGIYVGDQYQLLKPFVAKDVVVTGKAADRTVGGEVVHEIWPARVEPANVPVLDRLWPALFVVAVLPLYAAAPVLLRRWLPDRDAVWAIAAGALLFAVLHTQVWPSPIALFVLGLGLGWLAYRTQSLVGPITCHALFNAVGCLLLVFSPMAGSP